MLAAPVAQSENRLAERRRRKFPAAWGKSWVPVVLEILSPSTARRRIRNCPPKDDRRKTFELCPAQFFLVVARPARSESLRRVSLRRLPLRSLPGAPAAPRYRAQACQ